MEPAWVADARKKIERAEEHIRSFETEMDTFLDDQPPFLGIEEILHPTTNQPAAQFRLYRPLPPKLGLIAGDTVNNLRSALETMMWQWAGAVIGGKPPGWIKFYISASAADLEASDFKKFEGLSKPVIDYLRALQPYKGGNDVLWSLACLDNHNKHRTLVPVVTVLHDATIWPDFFGVSMLGIGFDMKDQVVNDGDLLEFPVISALNPQLKFRISFADVKGVESAALLPALYDAARVVTEVVDGFAQVTA